MKPDTPQLIRELYLRVCKDSGYTIGVFSAAVVTAHAIGCHPLDVWLAMPGLSMMEEIAAGTHAACFRDYQITGNKP